MKTRIVISALFLFSVLGLYGCEQQSPESPTLGDQPGQTEQPGGGMQQDPGQQQDQPGAQPGGPNQQ